MGWKNEVVTLEYAKRLRDLNVCQDSPFLWIEAPWKYEINTNLEKCVVETKVELVFGAYANNQNVIEKWPAPTVGMLMAWMPQYVTLKKDEPFNNFRFRLEKGYLLKENEILPHSHYIANFRCDSTEVHGEDAWMERLLFQHNQYDTNLADCLAKVIIELLRLFQIN